MASLGGGGSRYRQVVVPASPERALRNVHRRMARLIKGTLGPDRDSSS